MKKIILSYIANILLISSLYACDGNNIDREIELIDKRYDLSSGKYSENLKEYYNTVASVISQPLPKDKQLGIVVGENHEAEGAKCFEMLLLQIAQTAHIRHCLIELTPEKLDLVMKEGYKVGPQAGYLQRLIREARHLGIKEVPIDKGNEKKELSGLEAIKEMYLKEGEEREKYFIEQILQLDKSFIFYTGANHLSSLYYDKELNNKFFLIFINCSFPDSNKSMKDLEVIINMINDESVSRIHEQRKKFLAETTTGHSYKLPVMYNQRDSMIYKMLLGSEDVLLGVNLNEIRDYHPD